MNIIELENITKTFTVRTSLFAKPQQITVLDKLSFAIEQGEIICVVGESGCGKTTVGKVVTGLTKPSSGTILFTGKDIWNGDKPAFTLYRKQVQLIQQDPYTSLNPVQRIYDMLKAPLVRHKKVKSIKETKEKIAELLKLVDLTPVDDFIYKYPHQLSGGQRQRVAIARTLTVDPTCIVADEAVSMLDVSIRLSIVDLLLRLKTELGVTYLFITHDLAIAKYFGKTGRIAVMYLGRIVELGPTQQVIQQPIHPYTQILLAALPEADPEQTRVKKGIQLRSLDIPNLLELPSGCTFHPRCPVWIKGTCDIVRPELREVAPNQSVSCHNPQFKPMK
jgi:oligopeptide/dipeptide ABC transporter ATP-binding protein